MCSKYHVIKLESTLERLEDQIENLRSSSHVIHITAEQVISRREKNENVCEMSKNEKCKCKAYNLFFIVKYSNL